MSKNGRYGTVSSAIPGVYQRKLKTLERAHCNNQKRMLDVDVPLISSIMPRKLSRDSYAFSPDSL